MTGLYIDISDYLPDPIEEEMQRAIRLIGLPIEEYTMIASISNDEGWERKLELGSRGIGRPR